MSNKLSVTAGGVHRVGTEAYLTVDGVHRKALKMYRTTNGVHRLCYQAGTKWLKYSCNVATDRWYSQTSKGVGDSFTGPGYNSPTYLFSFGEDYEWQGSENGWATINDVNILTKDAVGYYWGYDTMIVRVDGYTEYDAGEVPGVRDPSIRWHGTIVAAAVEHSSTTYSQGDTAYGAIYADEGLLPEEGTLIEGSADGDYCVIKIGDTNYYYVKA